jgi:hypothetical protein
MKYEVKKEDVTYEINDTVLLADQPKDFRKVFNENRQGDMVEFDNVHIILVSSGRIIVTIKENEDGRL